MDDKNIKTRGLNRGQSGLALETDRPRVVQNATPWHQKARKSVCMAGSTGSSRSKNLEKIEPYDIVPSTLLLILTV